MPAPVGDGDGMHALLIPHPLQGHITPLLQLSYKLIESQNLRVTLVVPEALLPRMMSSSVTSAQLQIVGLPDNLAPDHPRAFTFKDSYEGVMGLHTSVDAFLQAAQPRPCSFIVADTFVTWAPSLALKYGIPCVSFATTNAAALSVMSATSRLIKLGILPLKRVNGSSKFADDLITCIPGIPPLLPQEFPCSLQSPSTNHYRMQFVQAQFQEALKSAAVIVNSVEEIEKDVLESLDYPVPVLTIGPTLTLNSNSSALQKGMLSSLWPEQNECLLWLNEQASGSVLYVSFGSVAQLTREQISELAYGLESSNQPFLWVIPPHQDGVSESDLLPDGFSKRIGNRCMIVSWTPQRLVLSHHAVGGFLTHCGWNSVLENMSLAGVPMICWPDGAEQALNAKFIVDVWGVGIRVHKEDDSIVKRAEIKRVVLAVMQGEGSRNLKQKTLKMKTVISQAVQEGGSSLNNIDRLLNIVKQAKLR